MRLLRDLLINEILVIGFGLLLFGLTLAAEHNFLYPDISLGGATTKQEVPKLEPTFPLVGTELTQFQDQYGPILSSVEATELRSLSGVRNLAIIKLDGNVIYLQRTVVFTTSSPWQIDSPLEITGLNVTATSVELRDLRGNRFVLNTTQPFVFQGSLNRLYIVDQSGQIWSALVKVLKFQEAKPGDESLPPNNRLSMSFGS